MDVSMKEILINKQLDHCCLQPVYQDQILCLRLANVSKFSTNSSMEHWQTVKRILHYLKSTSNQGITYQFNGNNQLIEYCDADYANDEEARKSTIGLAILARGSIS